MPRPETRAATSGGVDILLSGTVRALVAGSGLRSPDRGLHVLQGVLGKGRLLAVIGAAGST
jgi:hypothetical protein